MSTDVSGVFISAERLAALEKLEARHLAAEKKKKEVLAALHAKEKENPKQKSANVLANYYKHKDEINAKRRAQSAARKTPQDPSKDPVEGRVL